MFVTVFFVELFNFIRYANNTTYDIALKKAGSCCCYKLNNLIDTYYAVLCHAFCYLHINNVEYCINKEES